MSQKPLGSVEVSLSPLERFEEYLQSRGKRITQQRKTLVEVVFEQHEHFDADGLVEKVQKVDPSDRVSRPTIYRTLAELVEAGLLRKMEIGGRAVYEHDYGYPQHDHLLCQACGKLIEFTTDELIELRDAIARQHQFRVSGHRFIVQGTCMECLKARVKTRRPMPVV